MSSGFANLPQSPTGAAVAPPTACEAVIEQRLRQTRRQVKGVDVAAGVISLLIGLLVYLLAAAVIDHWLVRGGLGPWGRSLLWFVLVVVVAVYLVRRLLPPIIHRVNPIFAAAAIEQSQPSLKNSLINFLLLRGHRREVASPIYQAIEHRAAADISRARIDIAVDRTHLIRLGYALVAVLTVFSLYQVLSPKNPLRSAARVLLPWSNIDAPTRVTIHDVRPGSAGVFVGEGVTISAEVAGLRNGESPLLVYSTADRQTVDETIAMTQPEGEYRYQCRLPPGSAGLQQDCEYRIAAGDCRTGIFGINVRVAPALTIDKITLRPPSYTEMPVRTLEHQGDLRAIEGTKVTIEATANCDIKPDTAEIDLGCTGRRGIKMDVAGRGVVGRFVLRLDPNDPKRPEFDSYQLRVADALGRENNRPVRYRIDVVRDLPPTVKIVEPSDAEVRVAVDGTLPIRVRAEDPDFGLRRVAVRAESSGRSLLIPFLLEHHLPDKAMSGEFSSAYSFEPAKLRLKPGDRIQYWAEARDNRTPESGKAETGKQTIVVTAAENKAASGDRSQDKKAGEKGDQEERGRGGEGNPRESGDNAGKESQSRERGENAASPDAQGKSGENPAANAPGNNSSHADSRGRGPDGGEPGNKYDSGDSANRQSQGQEQGDGQEQTQGQKQADQPRERIDPKTDPGGAMQEILKDRQQQESKEGQQPQQAQPGQDSAQSGGQPDAGKQTGAQSGDENPSGADNDTGQPGGADQAGKTKPGEEKSGGDKQSATKESGASKSGSNQDDSKQPDDKGAGADQARGEQAGGKQKPGDEKSGSQSAAAKPSDGHEPGERESTGGKPNDAKSGEETGTGNEKSPGDKSADRSGGKDAATNEAEKSTNRGEQAPRGEKPGANARKEPDGDGRGDKEPGGEQKSGEQSGQARNQDSGGDGKKADDAKGRPAPSGANQPQQKEPGRVGNAPGQSTKEQPQSPSTSRRQSDSRGDTAGDRAGGGEQGDGQRAKKPGIGSGGSNTPADEGDSAAQEQGDGEIGGKPGDKAAAGKPTGSEAKTSAENGTGKGKSKPSGQGNNENAAINRDNDGQGTPQEDPGNGGTPGNRTSEGPAAHGTGMPTGGGKPGQTSSDASPETLDPADKANLEYARRQTSLALEHLRDQLVKEKPELLDRLGWTKDDARRFIDRWERMRKTATEKGAAGEAAKRQLEDTLTSLGLRPGVTTLGHGGVAPDERGKQRDTGRLAPPPDWAEQFREYTRGVSGERGKD